MTERRTSNPGVSYGEVLAGKFRVERKLGKGGMGIVLEATHLRLDERVAIKLLLRELADNPSTVERFMREARAASKIKSPHVVRVIDVDVLPDGAPYMVMERLEGFTLSQLSRSVGPLDPAHVAAYVVQACDAIAEAHALGIVHRDLKPSNLFLCRDRSGGTCVKVLDFGISKVGAALGGSEITQTDTLLGSPSYMSPEQLRSSREVDGRTDIWSLGVVLYQCTTGTAPFQADTMPQVCVRVLAEEPDAPRSLRPDLQAELEAIILRCLRKEPDDRFPSAAALADALRPHAAPSPVPWPDVTVEAGMATASSRSALRAIRVEDPARHARDGAGAAPASGRETAAEAAAGRAPEVAGGKTQETQGGWGNTHDQVARRARRRWTAVALVGAALVVGFVVAGFLVSSGAPDPTSARTAAPSPSAPAARVGEAGATLSTEAASPADALSDTSSSPDSSAPSSAAASASAEPSASAAPESKRPARPSGGSSTPSRKPPAKAAPADPFGVSRQ